MLLRALVFPSLLLLSGCLERVLIRTHPDGAHVSVNEQDLGAAPARFSVESRSIGDDQTYHYVIEKEGYETVQGFVPVVHSRGRVAGMIFTLGILRIFRGTLTFPEWVDVGLQPVTHVLVDKPTPSLTDALRDLESARSQGLITEDEYKRMRSEILNGR